MADGEESRILRPAAPGAEAASKGPAPRLPRPRRRWLRSTAKADAPTPAPAPAPDEQATKADAPAASTSADEQAAKGDAPAPTAEKADKPATKADTPTANADEPASTAKATDKQAANADEPAPTAKATDKQAANADEPAPTAKATDKQAASGADAAATSEAEGGPAESTPDGAAPGARRRRVRFAHAVRLPGPRTAARATRAWSRRPAGRLTLPGLFLLVLVAATAAAGGLLVPATLGASRPVAVGGSAAPGDPAATDAPPPGAVPPPNATLPPGVSLPPGATPTNALAAGRPSDALAGWAREVGAKVGIDPIAMQAYGYAELVLAETERACGLSWTTLAAIGFVESRHGQANNAQLGPDGRATPEIIGLPLDGEGGRMRIADTDRGELDGDTTYDRAIGPMQFIPTTWDEIGADADNDGRKDPHNLHDAALAAGKYLCKGGRNLTIPGDWWNAILSYNDVRRYAQEVFDTANRYGQASRA
ncbi:lytic transglycosylase domain-containing protein [Micromonospora endophytica]|uniref:lytic transglycosylase domain-containing protein n=3 Tax=Micromonospora endophytica TaxID=515350 RepID=UPI0020178EDD|nr:lytic transglycosylase domain-containing protein [Micromonospora endophytica]